MTLLWFAAAVWFTGKAMAARHQWVSARGAAHRARTIHAHGRMVGRVEAVVFVLLLVLTIGVHR